MQMNLSALLEMSNGRTMRVSSVKKYIDYLSAFGYSAIYLGMTDATKIQGEPYFNYNRAGYTQAQLREIDEYARQKNMELRMTLQTLAHMHYALRFKYYEDIRDTGDILLVGEEKTYVFIEKLIRHVSECVSSRVLHLGMDEAFDLGKGRYKELHGEVNRREIIIEHLNRVAAIAKKYGYRCEIWADMFTRMALDNVGTLGPSYLDELKRKLPENVTLYYWDYDGVDHEILTQRIGYNTAICPKVGYAGSIRTIWGLSPYNRIGCGHIAKQMDICEECGVKDYMITLWTDNSLCDLWSALPGLFYASEYNRTGKAPTEEAKKRFEKIVGIGFDDYMTVDYLNDPFMRHEETYSTVSMAAMFTDLLYGYFDYYLDERAAEQYRLLAEKYRSLIGKGFDHVFKVFALYAEIVSLKIQTGNRIRSGYKRHDLAELTGICDESLPLLIRKVGDFVRLFSECWDENYYPQGCEAVQYYLGGLRARLENVLSRLKEHVSSGKGIEELEREELPPSEDFTIENFRYTSIRQFMTFTNFNF